MMDKSDEHSYFFVAAGEDEAGKILSLYQSVIGSEFCTWNEFYPGKEEIEADYESGNLFVLRNGAEIVGAISIVPENELDDLEYWRIKNRKTAEIARVAISPEYQGRGLALKMVQETEKILKSRGCSGVHLLAALKNIPAYKTYQKAGYHVMGECDMFEHRYYAFEKELL